MEHNCSGRAGLASYQSLRTEVTLEKLVCLVITLAHVAHIHRFPTRESMQPESAFHSQKEKEMAGQAAGLDRVDMLLPLYIYTCVTRLFHFNVLPFTWLTQFDNRELPR